jgi:hypothetical protein
MRLGKAELSEHLRDWLIHSSGVFVDGVVSFSDDLSRAPLGNMERSRSLKDGEWVLLHKDGEPFVLAGIEHRIVAGRDCFTILSQAVKGRTRLSFWECAGPGQWSLFKDASFLPRD